MDVIKFAIPYEEGLIVIKRIKGNDENKEELEYVMLL